MQVMILDEDPALRTQVAAALAHEGFDVLSFGRVVPAKDAARRIVVDVLVLGEAVDGRLAHDVAPLAEWRNPGLGAILLSDRQGDDFDELFELIPSLQAVLGRHTDPRTLAQLALSAVRSRSRRYRGSEPEGLDDVEDEDQDGIVDDPVPVAAVRGLDSLADRTVSSADPDLAPIPLVSVPLVPAPAPSGRMAGPVRAEPAQHVPDRPALKPAPIPDPASTVLSTAETRNLLSDLARRYASMAQQPARLKAPPPAPLTPAEPLVPQPSSEAASLPTFEPLTPVSRPEPSTRVAASGRRLHLA